MSEPLPEPDGPLGVAPGALTVLEPALWQRLTDAKTFDELATAWLALQCRMIPGVVESAVLSVSGSTFSPTAARPESAADSPVLRAVAELALKEGRSVARGGDGSGRQAAVALPISLGGTTGAVVALSLVAGQGRDEMRGAVRQLQWGAAWLRDHLRLEQTGTDTQQLDRSRTTLDLLASVLEHDGFAAAALAAATDLAIRFDCVRVSIGLARRGSAKVSAISHTAHFGRQMSLVRGIGAAMDEAIDQRSMVLFPSPVDQPVATIAHADLARLQHDGQVLTIPLFVVDAYVGAITFERGHDQPFTPELVKLLDVIATAIGPILYEKRRNDRWIVVKLVESIGNQIKRLLGPGYIGRKLLVAALIALGVFFTFATDIYRVTSDVEVQGSVRRSIVSASDGYIQSANVRAGDLVKTGEVMAALEDRDLTLERLRWETEKQQHTLEYNQALATRQPATINIKKAEIAQADAQMKLLDEQLARTKLLAPFDGLVVSGDLSQRIGGAVQRGELLFEIAPLTGYRVIMHVDERQIAQLAPGQGGEVVFTSLPDLHFPITVEKITPVAQSKNGQNLFQVEADLTGATDRLRPGMIGVAKVSIDRRPLIAIWAQPIVDWLRIVSWRWMP